MNLNAQPVEKRVERCDGALDVVNVFETIQGEGPFVGRPAIFVRLAGCNLQCPACDTDYTAGRRVGNAAEWVNLVGDLWRAYGGCNLVVLTGGEPFRQRCGEFVRLALGWQYDVQVETNGTLYDPSMEDCWDRVTVVCSPKTGALNPQLKPHVTCLKYVLRASEVDDRDGLPTSSLLSGVSPARPWVGFTGAVFVQPCDEQDEVLNALNRQAAVASCLKFGYTLCLQTHKLLGLP